MMLTEWWTWDFNFKPKSFFETSNSCQLKYLVCYANANASTCGAVQCESRHHPAKCLWGGSFSRWCSQSDVHEFQVTKLSVNISSARLTITLLDVHAVAWLKFHQLTERMWSTVQYSTSHVSNKTLQASLAETFPHSVVTMSHLTNPSNVVFPAQPGCACTLAIAA